MFLKSRKKTLPALCLMLLAIVGCQPNATTSNLNTQQIVQRGSIRFVTDSQAGRQFAKQQGRPCLLFFTAEWCTFCHQMEATTFADPAIGELAKDFVCVLVDADREPEVCRDFAIRGYPTVQFLAADGRQLQRLVGRQPTPKLAAGMQAALERVAWLDGRQRQ